MKRSLKETGTYVNGCRWKKGAVSEVCGVLPQAYDLFPVSFERSILKHPFYGSAREYRQLPQKEGSGEMRSSGRGAYFRQGKYRCSDPPPHGPGSRQKAPVLRFSMRRRPVPPRRSSPPGSGAAEGPFHRVGEVHQSKTAAERSRVFIGPGLTPSCFARSSENSSGRST